MRRRGCGDRSESGGAAGFPAGGGAMNEEGIYPHLPLPHRHSFIAIPWGASMNERQTLTAPADPGHRPVTARRFPTITLTALRRTNDMQQCKNNRAGRSLASTPNAAAYRAAHHVGTDAAMRRLTTGRCM